MLVLGCQTDLEGRCLKVLLESDGYDTLRKYISIYAYSAADSA